jgi:transposase
MKNTQDEKILQIKFETLVVGIDIGKETHYARAFDYRGIEQGKLLRFSNTAQGYESLDSWMQGIMQQKNKTEAIVGFEPTGHYWFTLGDFLQRKGYKLGIVNPFHVKCTKELDDNSPTKNDKKDPKTIAKLVKDGRYRDVYIPESVYQELREAVLERERLNDQRISLNNQIIRWLDIRFPEFCEVFKDWSGVGAMIVLKLFPTPEKVLSIGAKEIYEAWKKEMKNASLKKAEMLVKIASMSIGRTAGGASAEVAIKNLLKQYEIVMEQMEEIEVLMQEMLLKVPYANKLIDIKGIGMLTVAVLVSEIGNIKRFKDPRQIVKLGGLNLRENSSGKHKGKTTISKRGRKRLREALFRVMIPMLANNNEFQAMHKRNITREKNPLNKMQSIIALCGKLIRVIYAILTKGCDYNAQKLMNDMEYSKIPA